MRWPLRRQIFYPIVGILVLTIGVVSALNAWLASAREARRLESQFRDVTQTLAASNFPLESNVLRQTRGLTGAEFVVATAAGRALAASDDVLLESIRGKSPPGRLELSSTVAVNNRRYIHAAAPLDRRAVGGGEFTLHVFYPEAEWREARWQAIWPPLAIGGLAIGLLVLTVPLAAAYLTRPIERLQLQVRQIAEGHFGELPLPTRDDEIRELATAINQMAQKLARYEQQTRKSERLKTLGTLGGGIAHQIRNAATGCRIALDLHQRDCPSTRTNGHAAEPLAVAVRQLQQIESHIQRFLALGRPAAAKTEAIDLAEVVSQVIDLVLPLATHVGVGLAFEPPAKSVVASVDAAAIVQLLVNLLHNGIEATAQQRVVAGAPSQQLDRSPTVEVSLDLTEEGRARIAVGDVGSGPSAAIQPRLFEPFATDKPSGTGLGLAVAKQIAEDHRGVIRWERREDRTWFIVELPCDETEAS